MNSNQTGSPAFTAPPLTERMVTEVFDALRSAALALAGLWKRRHGAAEEVRAFDSLAQLNEHTLKDIGAPNWLVAGAAEERETQRLRWIDFEVR